MGIDKLKKKMDIHKGSGDRSKEEKRVGNNYLNCNYKRKKE
ncbi:MAG: hypothetical protein ABIH64_04545 [Nanoarchaeota archaeon]